MKRFVAVFAAAFAAGSAFAAEFEGLSLTPGAQMSFGAPQVAAVPTPGAQYSNIDNFLGQGFVNGGTVGGITRLVADDIDPIGSSGNIDLTQFTFSVANFGSANISARPRVRFYVNDGPAGAPGTLLGGFSFNPISFAPGVGLFTASGIAPGSVLLPRSGFWAGLTFDNVGTVPATSTANMNLLGQGIFSPAVIGSSADLGFQTTAAGSFFVNNPAGSTFNLGGNPSTSFGWEFVPEPTSLVLLGIGALAAFRRR